MNSNDQIDNGIAETTDDGGDRSEERNGEAPDTISERAHWFSERAGTNPGSTSSVRYLNAVDTATRTPDDSRETIIWDSAIETISTTLKKENRTSLLFNSRMRVNPTELEPVGKDTFLGGFGKVISVSSVPPPYCMIAMAVNPEDTQGLDLDTAAFVHWKRGGEEQTIIEAARYFSDSGLLIARITETGFYRAIALARDSIIDSVLKELASKWSEFRFHFLTAGLELAGDLATHLHQAIKNLGGSSSNEVVTTFCERLMASSFGANRENVTAETSTPVIPVPEPPLLKLWRLVKLKADTWSSLGPIAGDGIDLAGRVTQIDTHPFNGNRVIAATAGGGIWFSNNAGDCWRPLMENEPTLTMGAVAYSPSSPNFIYAASGEDAGPWNPSWPGIGIYRSENEGETWIQTAKTTSDRFSAVIVDPCNPLVVYVAGNRGLHKSTNGGRSWIINPGLLSLFDGPVTDVVVDYDSANIVYIGVYKLGVLRSTTGGESIDGALAFTLCESSPLPTGCDAGWVKLAIGRNGTHRSRFVAAKLGEYGERVFATTDSGATWQEKTPVNGVRYCEWTSVLAVHPTNDSALFTGSGAPFLQISNDQGVQWSDTPVESEDQQDIAFDKKNDKRIYLANDSGMHRSIDGGWTWSSASKGLSICQVYDLDISEQDHEVVVCGMQDTGLFYRSKTGTWEPYGTADITQVAVDPTDSTIHYSLGPSSQNALSLIRESAAGSTTTCIKLGERGPWVPILKLHPYTSVDNPAHTREMFLCGSHTFYHSADAGVTFHRIEDKSCAPLITEGEITALEYAPGDPLTLYLGTSEGVLYKASRGGLIAQDWTRVKKTFPRSPIASIAIDWRNSNYVWIVFAGNGVSRSSRPEEVDHACNTMHVVRTTNGGGTWVNASGRIREMCLPDVPMSAIALDPCDQNVAYVGTDVGVFRTSNGGISWLAFQQGLPRSPVTELRLNRACGILFAATMGRGVYQRHLV